MPATNDNQKQGNALIGRMESAIEILGKFGAVCAGICLLAMTLGISAATISRYLFNRPWRFTEEFSGGLLLVVFFMGPAWRVAREGRGTAVIGTVRDNTTTQASDWCA